MKCFEIDLNNTLKISMLNNTIIKPPNQHCTRFVKEYILYAVIGGVLKLENNGELLTLYPGDIYIFSKGDFHKPAECTECNFMYVHFESNSVCEREMSEDEYCGVIRERKAKFLNADIYNINSYDYMTVILPKRMNIQNKDFFQYFINKLKSNTVSYGYNSLERRIGISFAVTEAMIKLEGAFIEALNGKNPSVSRHSAAIAEYIEANYRENFCGGDIEKALLLNFDYANRVFKNSMGCSILKYRNRLRINAAKTKLCMTDKDIGEIAEEVGFYNKYYFSRYFKQLEGMSPTEFRDLMIKQKSSEIQKGILI